MRNTKAKQIRKMLPQEDKISRRAYRRAKKFYSRLPKQHRADFLEGLKAMVDAK
jgi:ribosomal protein L13